jgi:hypothetical protein
MAKFYICQEQWPFFPFATTNRSALKDLGRLLSCAYRGLLTGGSLLGDKAVEEDRPFPLSHTSPGRVLKQRNNYYTSHYQRIFQLQALLKPPNIPNLIRYNLKTIILIYQQATASMLTVLSPEQDLNYKNSANSASSFAVQLTQYQEYRQ